MAENPRPHSQYGNRSDRGPRFYSRVFDYGKRGENLNGQKILVVGAGDDTFADKLGDKAMIVRIDPDYRNLPPSNPNMAYAAFSQNLPHPTGTFDETIALYSTMYMGGMGRGLPPTEALREMLRVTKIGGRVKIQPLFSKSHIQFLSHKKFDDKFANNLIETRIQRPSLKDYYTLTINLKEGAHEEIGMISEVLCSWFNIGRPTIPELLKNAHRIAYNAPGLKRRRQK